MNRVDHGAGLSPLPNESTEPQNGSPVPSVDGALQREDRSAQP
jgi:hypothetical protein